MNSLKLLILLISTMLATQAGNAQERVVPSSRVEVQLSFAPVVKEVAPAVVNVYAKRLVTTRSRSRMFDDPFFERFFGRGFGLPRQRVEQSLGSGVIVGSDGIIVTNNHVIEGGDEFKVVLTDRREFDAEVILADERTDLAVLRIDTKGEKLPSLTFADSDKAEVGDIVLAIGNPFGVGQTVTSGIVSAVARTSEGISDYQFFIQTDAAINPGNSGGALVGVDGELIGVNTAIYSRSGGSNGIGFAIPANMVKGVVETATSGKTLVRPWLGVKTQTVTAELAESLGLDRPMGVLINSIYEQGPVAKAGLKVGDVITAINDYEIMDSQGINYRTATIGVGGKATFHYLRQEKKGSTSVALVAPPEEPKRDQTDLEGAHPLSGVTVANLSPAVAEELSFDWESRGVVVVKVNSRGAGRRFGFQPGDIVLSINNDDIETVADLEDILSERKSRWSLSIKRGNRTLSMSVSG